MLNQFRNIIQVFLEHLSSMFNPTQQLAIIKSKKKNRKEILRKQEIEKWFNESW